MIKVHGLCEGLAAGRVRFTMSIVLMRQPIASHIGCCTAGSRLYIDEIRQTLEDDLYLGMTKWQNAEKYENTYYMYLASVLFRCLLFGCQTLIRHCARVNLSFCCYYLYLV